MLSRQYDCQSGSWKKAAGDSGAIGGYTVKITGYASPLFYGVGKIVSGQFFGDLTCDPQTVGTYCGSGGRSWCGSSASCAWNGANGDGYIGYFYYTTVGASALPIDTITQRW